VIRTNKTCCGANLRPNKQSDTCRENDHEIQ
jgi:hypothetical protein